MYEAEIAEAARKRGKRVRDLTESEMRAIALEVRSTREKLHAVSSAAISSVKTRVFHRIVSLQVETDRRKTCEECDLLDKLESGALVCKACGCSGKGFESKIRDASQSCPKGKWNEL